MTKQETVDAILCYHNHSKDHLLSCLESLRTETTRILIVDDASTSPQYYGKLHKPFKGIVIRRQERGGPASSFNHGAKESNATWLLYVDPHCIYQLGSVAQMRSACGTEHRFCLGTGLQSHLSEDSVWYRALEKAAAYRRLPLTFLIRRDLWEEIGGIPEVPYAHMDVLAKFLNGYSEKIACVHNVCSHHIKGNMAGMIWRYYQNGLAYGTLLAQDIEFDPQSNVAKIARNLKKEQIKQLLNLIFTTANQLGALEGLGLVPQEDLGMRGFGFTWRQEKDGETREKSRRCS